MNARVPLNAGIACRVSTSTPPATRRAEVAMQLDGETPTGRGAAMSTQVPPITGITSRKATTTPPDALQPEHDTCGSTTKPPLAEVPR